MRFYYIVSIKIRENENYLVFFCCKTWECYFLGDMIVPRSTKYEFFVKEAPKLCLLYRSLTLKDNHVYVRVWSNVTSNLLRNLRATVSEASIGFHLVHNNEVHIRSFDLDVPTRGIEIRLWRNSRFGYQEVTDFAP